MFEAWLFSSLLASAIAVFNHNLPHLRVHPGSSLLLVRQSAEVGSCPGQLGFSAPTCAAPFP